LGVRRKDRVRSRHHAERKINPPSDYQLEYGTSDIGWLQHHVDPSAARHEGKPKYKYLLPLDGDIVERLKQLSKPYPKMRRKRRHRCARLPVWRGRGSTERGAPIMSHIGMPARSAELKSTQVFNEAHTPTTTLASLPYSFSDFVDFSTVKENSFASYAFFNLDTFNLGDDHDVRAFRALYVSLIWQCHSDLPWTANCGPGG